MSIISNIVALIYCFPAINPEYSWCNIHACTKQQAQAAQAHQGNVAYDSKYRRYFLCRFAAPLTSDHQVASPSTRSFSLTPGTTWSTQCTVMQMDHPAVHRRARRQVDHRQFRDRQITSTRRSHCSPPNALQSALPRGEPIDRRHPRRERVQPDAQATRTTQLARHGPDPTRAPVVSADVY